MSAAHATVGGLGAIQLGKILVWASTWPIRPLDIDTATAFAGFILSLIAWFVLKEQPQVEPQPSEPPK